jgi:2-desacetyl-2-hydroxyethyl bacteriochlorophyllide A dehydrogenase
MRAHAVQFTAPGRVELVSVDLPTPRQSELVIRTAYSGISGGTEMLAYRGELDTNVALDETIGSLAGTFSYPFKYGYSCVGWVEHGTPSVPVGALVFAFHPHQDRLLVAETDVIPLDQYADPRLMTLFPLVETALQLTIDAGPLFGETVVITGLGAVGLLTALLLRRAGATVLASEPREWRRDIAASLGVTAVEPNALEQTLRDVTSGQGTGLVVELSGVPAALDTALSLLSHEGTVLVGSWYGAKPVSLRLGAEFHRRRLTIRSSQVSTIPAAVRHRWDIPRRRATVRQLLSELPLQAVATNEYRFADATDAYAAIDRGEPGMLHVALRYE